DQKPCTFEFPNDRRAVAIERCQLAAILVAKGFSGGVGALKPKRPVGRTVHPQVFTNDECHPRSRFFSDALGHVLPFFEFLDEFSLFFDLLFQNSKLPAIRRSFHGWNRRCGGRRRHRITGRNCNGLCSYPLPIATAFDSPGGDDEKNASSDVGGTNVCP